MHSVFQFISTTAIYLVVIVLSVLLNVQAEIKHKKRKKREFRLLSLISILLPCLLAAFRGETVGNDVLVYAQPCYFLANRASGLVELFSQDTRFEYGYLALGYLSSHVFNSFNVMLFFTQLMILAPIYIGAHKFRNRIPAWSTLLCFYFFFYVETFNIMRQGIAVSFLFLALAEYVDCKKIRALCIAAIAILFHNTAIIGASLLLFVILFSKISNKQIKMLLFFLVTVAVPLVMSRWTSILTALSSLGIIKARYANYIGYFGNKAYFTQLGLGNYLELGVRWLGCIIPFIFRRRKLIKNENHSSHDDLVYSLAIGTLLATLIYTAVFIWLHSSYGYRVSFYLEILFILWMSTLVKKGGNINIEHAHLGTVIMIATSFLCFIIIYMWRGMHGTLPFYFQIYDF